MTAPDEKLCAAYDQISDRSCRYYADHGGKHNFARLDHDCVLERELRRQLDEMTSARDEACDIAAGECLDETWSPAQNKRTLARIEELRAIGAGETIPTQVDTDEILRAALVEALALFDANWCAAHGHAPTSETFDKAVRLKKLVDPTARRSEYP